MSRCQRLVTSDCVEAMRELPDASVHAIVTDPPYGLGFMGKAWDDLPPGEEWGRECLRVLKPGGHLLAFGGSRTYHRLACAVEDAGFEVRDQMMWLYGSGFPKAHNVSKAIDRMAGAEREVIGSRPLTGNGKTMASGFHQPDGTGAGETVKQEVYELTAPATPEAEAWNGWGTALKPAHEPIVVARKPLAGTVAENVLRFGTGALNIDGCRIGNDTTLRTSNAGTNGDGWGMGVSENVNGSNAGRWPANVVLDEEAGRLLDDQSGERPGGAYPEQRGEGRATGFGEGRPTPGGARAMGDTGGASRFFYCAKASKGERNAGLDDDRNVHPTVKPISLMRYLVRLVTPPEGTVLDPFLGSGTTGCAAVLEGFDFIGIERDPDYVAIAEARIAWWDKHRGDGETAEILKAAGVRDEIESSGQLELGEAA